MADDQPELKAVLVISTEDLIVIRRLGQLAQAFALAVMSADELERTAAGVEPAVAVIDLHQADAVGLVRSWRLSWPDAIVAGYLNVPDRDRWVEAQRAGCDLVANRGALIPQLRDRLSRPGSHEGRRFPLFEAADAAGRLGLVYRADDSPVGPLAVYQVSGQLHAIADICPHAGSPLSGGDIDSGVVTCPAHGSRFDVCTGERVRGPADTDIATFRLVQEGGQICLLIREP